MPTVSYAEIAAKGPKQTPEEAAAPQPTELEQTESVSASSIIDVDLPSVRTVPSDFLEQDVQTSTQADRVDREDDAKAAGARAVREAREARDKAAARARKADSWLTRQFADMSEGASSALVVANFAAVLGVAGWLSFKGWGLYERGRLGWKAVGLGVGIMTGVAAVEGVFANYLDKGKKAKKP